MPTTKQLRDLADEAIADAGEWKRRAVTAERALQRAIPWLGKLIADKAHLNSVAPNDAIGALQQAEAAMAAARSMVPSTARPADAARAMLAALRLRQSDWPSGQCYDDCKLHKLQAHSPYCVAVSKAIRQAEAAGIE